MAERKSPVCNCSALRQAARFATRLYDDALAPVGIGINQYSVLANLRPGGAKGLQDLADLMVMDRSTLGHLLRPLEARGLVAITVPVRDKRQRVIALTRDGGSLLDAAQPHWTRAQDDFERAFGAAESGALRETLAALTTLQIDNAPSRAEGPRA